MKKVNKIVLSTATIMALVLTGCGEDGSASNSTTPTTPSSTTVKALKLPSSIDIIKAQDEGASSNLKKSINTFSQALQNKYEAPSESDYVKDTSNFYVRDDSTEALSIVNMIMGFIRDTNYQEFVNKGPYIAMIKEDEDKKENQNTSQGQTSTNQIEELKEFVIDVTRENNNSEMIINGWIKEEDEEFAQNISFKINVTKAVSTEYPAGEFTMYIKGIDPRTDSLFMRNILKIGKTDSNTLPISVQYKEETGVGSAQAFSSEANLLATTDLTSGEAYTKSSCENPTTHSRALCEYKIAYNNNYAITDLVSVNGQVDSNTTGQILDKNSYTYKIHNYGLYKKTTGNRPQLNASQHIKVTLDGETYHGHAGYWGIWAGRDNLDLTNAVIEDDEGNNYTIFTAPGKLEQHSKKSVSLEELDGVELNLWSDNSEKLIEWNKTDQKFYQTGTKTWNNSEPSTTRLAQNIELNASEIYEWDGAWCKTLQTHFNIGRLYTIRDKAQTPPTNITTLKYFQNTTVAPGTLENDLNLVSYSDIKYKGTITEASLGGNSIVEPINWSNIDWENADVNDTFKSNYSFSKSTMTLNAGESVDPTKSIVFASDINESNLAATNYSWGLRVEPLLDQSTLTSVSSQLEGITINNWWQIKNQADRFYSWNTSVNDWSKLKVLKKEDGSFVSFEEPWVISYTHSTDNDRDASSEYDGKEFRLHYDGHNLDMPWGYDEKKDRWKPLFSLKNDVEFTYDGTTYVIKALEGEKILNKVTATEVIANGGTVPSLNNVNLSSTNLNLSDIDNITFKDRPTSDLTVKVIKGTTQP